jgi:hypothetical protein
LNLIRGVNGSPYFESIYGKFDGKNLQKWFLSRVSYVGKNLCTSDLAVACVLSAWDNKIWLSPHYTQFSQPQMARLMVLFHEARHTEKRERFWPHSKCPKVFKDDKGIDLKSIWTGAPLAGEMACDIMIQGSYGSAAILLRNIAENCTSCTEKVRLDAALFGNDQVKRLLLKEDQAKVLGDHAKTQ